MFSGRGNWSASKAYHFTHTASRHRTARPLIQEQITQIDSAIRTHIAADEALQKRHDILTSCKSVGDTTAATLIAEMPELGSASNTQIAALAGRAPFNHDRQLPWTRAYQPRQNNPPYRSIHGNAVRHT